VFTVTINDERIQFKSDVDFRPMAFSSDTSVTGPLAFIGYGISSDTLHYDDYANIDVKGKVVIILRYSPDGKNQASHFGEYTAFRKKIMIAREKGAFFNHSNRSEDLAMLLLLPFS
jgi:aminopeptidase YwaD